MKSARATCLLIFAFLVTIGPAQGEDPPGRTATCDDLIGFWKLVPLDDPSINETDRWPLPNQWFGFYENGRLASMMSTENRDLSASELDEILSVLKDNAPSYSCVDSWLIVEYPDAASGREVWGKNIFTRRAGLQNRTPFEVGDVVMSLVSSEDGRAIYYRRLRKLEE